MPSRTRVTLRISARSCPPTPAAVLAVRSASHLLVAACLRRVNLRTWRHQRDRRHVALVWMTRCRHCAWRTPTYPSFAHATLWRDAAFSVLSSRHCFGVTRAGERHVAARAAEHLRAARAGVCWRRCGHIMDVGGRGLFIPHYFST